MYMMFQRAIFRTLFLVFFFSLVDVFGAQKKEFYCIQFYSKSRLGLTSKYAETLFKKKRYQESVWMLQKIGDFERADKLEEEIRNRLSFGKIISFNKMEIPSWEGRISELYLVTMENGLRAIFKSNAEYWTDRSTLASALANTAAEMMASLFSRELKLGMTPITVLRSINGMDGSLQTFVDFETRHDYSWEDMQKHSKLLSINSVEPRNIQLQTMMLFDYLIYNTDRSPYYLKEWFASKFLFLEALPGQDSGLVLIDQAAAFQEQANAQGRFIPSNPVNRSDFNIKNQQLFYENLKTRLTEDRIRILMTGYFSKKVIQETIKRRANILAAFEKKF